MKNNTLDFYNNNSKSYIESTIAVDMSHLYNEFLNAIPLGGTILDLGCGSGRDSKVFLEKGYKIIAVDGCNKLAKSAEKLLGQEVIVSSFENLKLNEMYDGVWACASLLHVNRFDIVKVIKSISSNLKTNGVFYMSFKYGEDEYIDDKGRYFNCYTEDRFLEMIINIKDISIISVYKSGDTLGNRDKLVWLNILMKKS